MRPIVRIVISRSWIYETSLKYPALNNLLNYIITNYYLLTAPISYGDIMERQPVQSCNLKSVGYDNNLKNLEIEFHSGLIYQYQNVPSQIFANLLSAQSTGTFFTDKIKNRYRSKRLDKVTVQWFLDGYWISSLSDHFISPGIRFLYQTTSWSL